MSDEILGDTTEPGWTSRRDHGSGVESLSYPDGRTCIRHLCDRDDRGVIYATPALQLGAGHTIIQADPLTVSPSIKCDDCGLHGFIVDGTWR